MAYPVQKGTLTAVIYPSTLWAKLSRVQKLSCLLKGDIHPSPEALQAEALTVLLDSHFGDDADFGPILLHLAIAKEDSIPRRELIGHTLDEERDHALKVMALQLSNKLRQVDSNFPINLALTEYGLDFPFLCIPMSVVIPVHSIRWFVELDYVRSMSCIRRSLPKVSDQIADYLYEICTLQIKTCSVISSLREVIAETVAAKGDSLFGTSEHSTIVLADSVVSYLKSSSEKIVLLLGVAFEIGGLDSQMKSSKRMDKVRQDLPEWAHSAFYFDELWEMLSAISLQELNNLRNGILHKKGIGKLQPHSYVGVNPGDQPSVEILSFTLAHHRMMSLAFLSTLALIVDHAVQHVEPIFSPNFGFYRDLIYERYHSMRDSI